MDNTLHALADLATSITYDRVPPAALHETKRRLIDFLGCALGAFSAEPVQAARRMATKVDGGELGATVWGTSHRSSADLACFANGLMGRYLDFNDQYSGRTTGHPSDVIPAVLAAAEVDGAGGRAALTGILTGYEFFGRLCDAVDIRTYWDHSTLGAIAGAAAAANTLGLSPVQTAHAISISTVSNNALGQTRRGELSDWKAGAFPNAARQGLFAALLAQEGITGPDTPFEGEQGFWKALAEPEQLPQNGELDGLFKLTESAIKYNSGCYLGLCALDAAVALRDEVDIDDIQAISVHTYRYGLEMTADSPAKWRPQTRETADHSLPFLIAMGLREGFVGPEHYVPQYYMDPQMLDVMDKVTVQEESRYSEQFPHVQSQRVEVQTRGGAHLVKQIDFPKGHPENPMTDTEVQTKFRRLTADHLSAGQAEAAIEVVLDLENVCDLQTLSQALVL